MIAGLVSMVVLGVTGEEGVAGVWQSALDRGRIKLADWTADPTQVCTGASHCSCPIR